MADEVVSAEVAAPVVTEAPSAPPVPATEGNAPVEESKPEAKPEPRQLSQDEVNRIVRKERLAAEKRAYDRARVELENERLRSENERLRGPQGQQSEGEPTPEQFKDWDSYNRALVRWEIKQAQQGEVKQTQVQSEQAEFQRAAQAVQQKIGAPGSEKYDDFVDVVSAPGVAITGPMLNAMYETDVGPDVAYHLGLHPEESRRIAGLSIAGQIREIDKIASTLKAPPKVTKVPAPIEPTGGKSSVEKDPNDMSYAEFVKWRRNSLAQK